jgi:ParB/RepB/Spo0J family partition protein
MATKKKTDRTFIEVDIKDIIGNRDQTRDAVPRLHKQGYGVFEPVEGSDKPSLASLALSSDLEQRQQFIGLIDQHENGNGTTKDGTTDTSKGTIRWLADDMGQQGQLQPIRVRSAEDGKYHLVFGCRRCLARMYIHASDPKLPARLTAEVVDAADDKVSLFASFGENIRADPSPMDEARLFAKLKKVHGMSPTEIAKAVGLDVQVVRMRQRLNQLPSELQEKVHEGRLGVVKALKILEGSENPDAEKQDTRRKMPTLKEAERLYNSRPADLPSPLCHFVTEEARMLLAYWLDIQYKPLDAEPEAADHEEPVSKVA